MATTVGDGARERMDQSTGLLLGALGLALVCGGLVLIALLVVLRVTGRSALSFLGLLARDRMSAEDDGERRRSAWRRPDLRARAEAAKAELPLPADAASAPPAFMPPPDVTPSVHPPAPRRDRRDAEDEDLLAGLLDDEAGGPYS